MIPFVNLKPSIDEIRPDLERALQRVVDRGVFLSGPEVAAFEAEWAKFCGTAFCVACASGTDALMLAAFADGRDQIIPANTLPFTETGLRRAGLAVEHDDVDDRGWPLNCKTTPVLLYGRFPPEHFAAAGIVDACQAHGWISRSPFTLAAWSFYPTKNLGGCGDGGAVTTGCLSHYELMRRRADLWHSRMSELNASILRTKIPHLDRWNAERLRLAEVYWNELPDWCEPVCLPSEPSNHHLFAVLVDERDALELFLLSREIGVKVHYRQPLASLPGASRFCSRVLSLPLWVGMTPETVRTVCDTIRVFHADSNISSGAA